MIQQLKQKDIEACIDLVGGRSSYDNLKTRMLASLQAHNSFAAGYFQNRKLLGFVFYSSSSFDLTIHLLWVKNSDEVVIKNLVNHVKEKADLLGARAIYINHHSLSKEVLNLLEILEQYRLE
ncbi:hypothetical protein GF389_04835 [Candidatus Dojkabacteria bacterium]|nr:hypothetical protein [Candidatus Dojkabacteria bacterium]